MKKHHDLKIAPVYFDAVNEGRKTFEVRNNDRGFKNADTIMLKEWDAINGYSGREILFEIGYVLPLENFYELKMKKEYVAFSLLPFYSYGSPDETAK